ncbi:hypothetical protein [Marinicrinis lubricantis]|uniref:Uncharacterized protein n=1 Tax=Marinicrinis lubricantis TaxID=2086470 RepID=A0ABW1INI4_9BACL
MTPLTIGPFVLEREMFFLLLSVLAGYAVLKFRINKTDSSSFEMDSMFTNSILLSFLVWKFSLILFDPLGVIRQPAMILYFDGGITGIWLAVGAVLIYLFLKKRKNGIPWSILLDGAAVSWFGMYGTYHLLLFTTNHFTWMFHLLAMIWSHVILGVWIRREEVSLPRFIQYVLWYLIGHAFIQFFSHAPDVFWGLNGEQSLYLVLAAITVVVSLGIERGRR